MMTIEGYKSAESSLAISSSSLSMSMLYTYRGNGSGELNNVSSGSMISGKSVTASDRLWWFVLMDKVSLEAGA